MSGDSGSTRAGRDPSVSAHTPRLGREEFAREYERHWRLFWCAAVAVIGDRAMAQDIVQQGALIALERLDQFDPATSFTAWMTAIVRNTALNESRKRTRRRTLAVDGSVLDSAPIDARANATAAPTSGGFDGALGRALEALEETTRLCLLMRVVADMPYRQIAVALAIPEGTAASHVHRGRAALREALRDPSQAGEAAGRRSES